jgi:signal recognition particle receptor subunit beta
MVVLNYTGGEVNAKIVYYGPGLSGKTTNLEFIHDRTPEGSRGKMVSMKTQTDRTLFFDFLPLELGEINGYRTRFLLYTVPGQVYYNATRKLVLKGVDAVVFVADSSRSKLDENLESLRNLEQNLNEHGMSLDEIPWVIQYNKRDIADAMAVTDLDARLNPLRVPSYEAIGTRGAGVYETFHGIATLVYRVLKERLERGDLAGDPAAAPARPEARPAAPAPRAMTQPAEGEIEFDNAIDSMLREMDGPAARPAEPASAPRPAAPAPTPAPRVAPAPARSAAPAPAPVAGQSVQATMNVGAPTPAAVRMEPSRVAVHAAQEAPARQAAPTVVAPAPAAIAHDDFQTGGDSFDLELGRLPSLDDASFASDTAREEGPHEFITDPMRRRVGADAAPPRAAAPHVAPPQPAPAQLAPEQLAPEPAASQPPTPRMEAAPAEFSVTVPVVLTRAQIRSGLPVRVLLDIRVKDE